MWYMPLLIALSVGIAVTASAVAMLQARGASAVAAQARLERVAGRLEAADWVAGNSVALRANRLSSISWMQRLLADIDLAQGLELLLVRADWNMRVSEFLATLLLVGGIGMVVGTLLLHHVLIGVVLFAIFAYVPLFLLKRAAKRRIKKIEKQLVEMLVMVSNALKAGFGLMQAFDQAARQLDPPIAQELRQLRRDTQVGSTVEEAITNLGKRIGSYDLDIVVTAVLVQRNVGGNLSDILDGVAHTIRERERIRGEIATLIAEEMMTALLIGGLPVIIAGLFYVMNPSYMTVLWTEPVGRIMLGSAIFMELCGLYLIKRIITIDI